jgi:hypothetical protein
MDIEHEGAQRRRGANRARDRVRNVVELQIEEQLRTRRQNLGDALRAVGRKEFEPQLEAAAGSRQRTGQPCGAVELSGIDRDQNTILLHQQSSFVNQGPAFTPGRVALS